jgi:ABC-type phosphate transport system permease subunit
MEIISNQPVLGRHPIVVDKAAFGEYLAVYSGVCFSLAASLFLGLTMIVAAIPLTVAAAVFFTAKSGFRSLLSLR